MSVGVYCGVGAHDQCIKPRCGCICHSSSGTNSLLDQRRTEPARRCPSKVAVVVTDPVTGRRLCPECRGPLEKKNPHGPGRYPSRCESCRVAAKAVA